MRAAKAIRRPVRRGNETGITHWETFIPVGRAPERIIVALHGGFQLRPAGKRKKRVLEWLRTSAEFDSIGQATRAIVLYPRARYGDWKTGNRTHLRQLVAIHNKLDAVQETLPKRLPVGFVGFSDGGTTAHICACKLARAAFAVIYSAPIRQWDMIEPPHWPSRQSPRYLLIHNPAEVVADKLGDWRPDFEAWCDRQRVPYDKFDGHVEPFGALRWKHAWDVNLNDSIAAWINANS